MWFRVWLERKGVLPVANIPHPFTGGDYLAVNYSNSFLPMSTVDGEDRCFNVTILDDQAFEKTETFYLLLEAEEGVTIGDYSPALVEIMDDDGKKYSY